MQAIKSESKFLIKSQKIYLLATHTNDTQLYFVASSRYYNQVIVVFHERLQHVVASCIRKMNSHNNIGL